MRFGAVEAAGLAGNVKLHEPRSKAQTGLLRRTAALLFQTRLGAVDATGVAGNVRPHRPRSEAQTGLLRRKAALLSQTRPGAVDATEAAVSDVRSGIWNSSGYKASITDLHNKDSALTPPLQMERAGGREPPRALHACHSAGVESKGGGSMPPI